MSANWIVLGIIVLIGLALAYSKSRKKKHNSRNVPPVTLPTPPAPPAPPSPPAPPAPPAPPTYPEDRNGKRFGQDGYDPRIDRPQAEFSPVEPVGAYYGEGPFDPTARWVGTDGVHYPQP